MLIQRGQKVSVSGDCFGSFCSDWIICTSTWNAHKCTELYSNDSDRGNILCWRWSFLMVSHLKASFPILSLRAPPYTNSSADTLAHAFPQLQAHIDGIISSERVLMFFLQRQVKIRFCPELTRENQILREQPLA